MRFRTLGAGLLRRLHRAGLPRPADKLRGELFVVVYPAGTDVGAFAAALNRHPALICHADPLGPLSPAGFACLPDPLLAKARESKAVAAFQAAFPEAYLYKYLFDSRGRRATGFQIERDRLLDSPAAAVRNVLMLDKDVRVILYAARNLLRMHVAELRHRLSRGEVKVEADSFLLQARRAERMNDYIDRLFQDHPRLKLDADRFEGPERVAMLDETAEFLGLGAFRGEKKGEVPQPLRRQVANPAELEAALSGTPYAWMLES